MITTGNGTIELVNGQYIEFISHLHITGSRLQYLKEDVIAFDELLKGKRLPIISIIHRMDKFDSESENYIRNELPRFFTKMAIVSESTWTFYLFKLLSSFVKFPIPTTIFSTKEDALEWI